MIDPELLPELPLIDTNVLIRGLGERPNDQHAPDCREFLKVMREQRRDILVAAPSIAEVLRFKRGKKPPVMEGLLIVPFDDEAARVLGENFPEELLHEWRRKDPNPLHYYKYDALIVACAVRWKATCVVALDKGVRDLATEQNLRAEMPGAFHAKQGQLALVHSAPPTSSAKGHGSATGD